MHDPDICLKMAFFGQDRSLISSGNETYFLLLPSKETAEVHLLSL